MSQVIVKLHSQHEIDSEITGFGKGRLITERIPKIGTQGGMGFGGGEMLCLRSSKDQ